MAKELTKEELKEVMQKWNDITTSVNTKDFAESLNFLTNTLPDFFQNIYKMGYSAGVEEGKQIKFDNIVKSN